MQDRSLNFNSPFCLERSCLNITSRCTLKCKLCACSCPYLSKPPHYNLETCERSIINFFKIVDYVRCYVISGGEPLLHESLPQMIGKVMEYREKFEKLQIITNGTLIPSGELRNSLLRFGDKIFFIINHYGELSKKADELIQWLEKNNIEVKVNKYFGDDQYFGGWVDFGNFIKRNRSKEESLYIFSHCGYTKMKGCLTTHNGKAYWCSRAAIGMGVLNLIPDEKSEYIDLFDDLMSVSYQREKIKSLFCKEFLTACDYCSGDFGNENVKRYPAAEQL